LPASDSEPADVAGLAEITDTLADLGLKVGPFAMPV
jgi:hypothetical protein